jgi:hypothetical protein
MNLVSQPPRGSVRRFEATVTYRDALNKEREEIFPIYAANPEAAKRMALDYVLSVLKLDDFELRVVGA